MKKIKSCGICLFMVVWVYNSFAQTDFNYTGDVQTFEVPEFVTSIKIEAWGAQGGGSEACDVTENQDDGGLGGYSTGELSVTPGQILNVYVGGKPVQVNGVGSPGGYNGGGSSGWYGGAGGGGSSYLDGLSDASTISGVRPGNGLVVILATDIIYKDGFE